MSSPCLSYRCYNQSPQPANGCGLGSSLNLNRREEPHSYKNVMPEKAKNGSATFWYATETGERRYFHSPTDPEEEGKQWAEQIKVDKNTLVVILGGGFFYHVRALIKKLSNQTPLVIIEPDREIFQAAQNELNLNHVLDSNTIYTFVGNNPSDAINYITKLQLDNSLKNVLLLSHTPSIQTFPEFYQPLLKTFTVANKINLFDRLRYKKFCHQKVRVLLLTTRYFLMGEIMNAMKTLDVSYHLITIEDEEIGAQIFLEKIIKNILSFKPDFIFTINHMGLDREGALSQFFSKIEMPFVSWYVDNPNLVITNYQRNITPFCVLLLWDKNTLSDMRKLGFEHTFYLPLGVDENRFHPIKPEQNPFFPHLSARVSFVGNSMVYKAKNRLKKTGVKGKLKQYFPKIAFDFAHENFRDIEEIMYRAHPSLYENFLALTPENQVNYKMALIWEATKLYRLERISKLLPFSPLIVGDQKWFDLIDSHQFKYHQEISYYTELPFLYNLSSINFNATSQQMKGAVNQRVFDVPACRGFLLTDFQEQMTDLFEIGKEVICYHDPAEIEELVAFYLGHEKERTEVSNKGYERVLKDHTYMVRVKKIIEVVKTIFS